MAEVLRGRGCDVQLAAIEFTDPRYAGRFQEFPIPHPFRELVGMIPAESPRRRPAKIAIPDVVTDRDYDLVCIGSPAWWLSTDVPVRSFLQSETATRVLGGKPFAAAAVCCRQYWKHNLKTVRRLSTERGGVFADGIHFRYQGGQVRSLLSPLSYLGPANTVRATSGSRSRRPTCRNTTWRGHASSRTGWPTGCWRAPAARGNPKWAGSTPSWP